MTKPRKHLLVSLLFLVSSIALYAKITPDRVETPAPVAIAAPVSQLQVEGVWEQYAVDGCHRDFMARLDIRARGADYVANPLSLSANTFPKHAYRSYDHQVNGDTWTFKEDWDYGMVGEFTLERQPNGEYWGVAYSEQDGHSFRTVFVRVAD